jgi:thiamine pyrophosphokinase
MSLFVILLGGDLTVTSRLLAQIAGARVIAADSGIRHSAALGVVPELWVGDFDSVDDDDRRVWATVGREVYPSDKDKTDGELAADAAIARGATALILVGAFGGERADHAFLHMTSAIGLAERGFATRLTSGREEGQPVLPGRMRPDLPQGTLFSLLPFSDLSGLSIRGVKWPLSERFVPFGSSLTMSNVVDGDCEITLTGGRAMLVARIGM